MEKLNIAIVGCGSISQLNVPGYLDHPQCDVVALCDPVIDRAIARAESWGINPKIYSEYSDLLNDDQVDAVERELAALQEELSSEEPESTGGTTRSN